MPQILIEDYGNPKHPKNVSVILQPLISSVVV